MSNALPITTTTATTTVLTQTLQLHENQRFWIGQGFTGALLPNDRGRFSLTDGSQSWKSITEAADNVLGLGWQWVEEEEYDGDDHDNTTSMYAGFRPASDWMYARDFSPSAVRDAQMQRRKAWHWVRFRILERTALWTGEFDTATSSHNNKEVTTNLATATTKPQQQHCDSKIVTTLAQVLLEVLVYAVMVQDGIRGSKETNEEKAAISTSFKQATVLRIQSNLILHLLHFPTPRNDEQPVDAFYQLELLQESLKIFAESERCTGLKSVFSTLPPFAKRLADIPDFTKLCQTLSETHFSLAERQHIAMWTIQTKLDPKGHQMQCQPGRDGCTNVETCIYAWLSCPNHGCNQIMSRMYLESHIQDECNYQIVPCPDCGDSLLRHEHAHHLAMTCLRRDATCPFAHWGCPAVVPAQEIPAHVQDHTSAHLLLSLQRMKQYETQFRHYQSRIEALELAQANLQKAHQTQQERAAQTVTALERTVTALQKRVNNVERQGHRGLKQLKTELEKSHVK